MKGWIVQSGKRAELMRYSFLLFTCLFFHRLVFTSIRVRWIWLSNQWHSSIVRFVRAEKQSHGAYIRYMYNLSVTRDSNWVCAWQSVPFVFITTWDVNIDRESTIIHTNYYTFTWASEWVSVRVRAIHINHKLTSSFVFATIELGGVVWYGMYFTLSNWLSHSKEGFQRYVTTTILFILPLFF